jgi:MFS family permease
MKNTFKLSLMMFLQYMMLPVWFVPMLPYVNSLEGGSQWILWCGLIMGFGTFTSPLLGMFADRFINAERVLAICNFAGFVILSCAFFVTNPAILFALMLLAMCFYMPTWSLTASIAMANASEIMYPRIRVFGTLGWVSSGVFSVVGSKFFGLQNFDLSPFIFLGGAFVSFLGGVLSFILPPTKPCMKGVRLSISDALGLKALVLFKDRNFLAFSLVIFLSMIPFQWYNVYCSQYLNESGFKYLTLTLNLGQVGEIFFMFLVAVIIKKFAYKGALVIALCALLFRNVSFAVSSYFSLPVFDIGAILVHGLIFGLFIVGSQMYVAENTPKELRNQAQGLMNLITAGIGVFASNVVFDFVLGPNFNWTRAYIVAAVVSLIAIVGAVCFMRKATNREKA